MRAAIENLVFSLWRIFSQGAESVCLNLVGDVLVGCAVEFLVLFPVGPSGRPCSFAPLE